MRKILQIASLLLPFTGTCQNEFLARMPISGAVSELGVSPSEEIWVATKAGNVYHTKQVGDLWHFGPFGSKDEFSFSNNGTFERINFFTEDTMMISGFIPDYDFIYWSGDHGKNWEKVKFGKGSWIDAAFVNGNGKAWMSGNSQLIYYTEDYGKSWEEFGKVEQTGNLRFSTIHFNKDERTGLFGSFWNVLYKTADNCKSWEKLQTPLSQNKYSRLSKEERPDIRKIRMFGDFYIINQQGRVFISKSDNINWKHLPNVIDFEVSASDRLFIINRDLTVQIFNASFEPVWRSAKQLHDFPRAIAVRNDALFALTFSKIYKINQSEFLASDLLTDEIPIPEPYFKVQYKNVVYGFDENDILLYDKKNAKWHRFMTLDFGIGNATIYDNRLLVTGPSLSQYFAVDEEVKTLQKFGLPEALFSTGDPKVAEFHLEIGSQGCFHSDNQRIAFLRRGDRFIVDMKMANTNFLSKVPREIDANTIEEMLRKIDKSRFDDVSIEDLHLSDDDVVAFKKFIDREAARIKKSGADRFDFDRLYSFVGENADFDYYKRVADSLFLLPTERVDEAFWQAYGNWSTTTEWRRVIFVFDDGRKRIIENSDDKPNYLYTPWIVDFDGLKFKSNSIAFGESIRDLTKGEFFVNGSSEKKYAIFKIADYLYQRKLSAEIRK